MDDIYTDVYEKLSTLQWLMRCQQMNYRAEAGPFADTTRGQGRILAMLKIQPEIATKDLAYLLGIRQQSLNELLNKLEKNGYVERKPSDSDKRVMIVHLTEKGKQVQQPVADHHEILDCLSAEELEQLAQYLGRLIQALEKQVDDARMDNNRADWRTQANARMREPRFEQLLSMRARAFGHRDRPAENSDNIPGAERFSPDYDGFVPQREDIPPFGGRRGTKE